MIEAAFAVAVGLGLLAANVGDDSRPSELNEADTASSIPGPEDATGDPANESPVVVVGHIDSGELFVHEFAVPWHGGTLSLATTDAGHQLTHTVDGDATDIPLGGFLPPLTEMETVASDGERFAIAGRGDGPEMVVGMTEDLKTWATVTLREPTPPGLPPAFVFAPNNDLAYLTVSEWGWALIAPPRLVGVDSAHLVSLGVLDGDDEVVSIEVEEPILVVRTADRTLRLSAADLGVEDQEWILGFGVAPFRSAWAGTWGEAGSRSTLVVGDHGVAVHAAPNGFYALVDLHNEPNQAFATTGDGWYPTNPAPGAQTVSADSAGLVSGGLIDGETGATFWISDDLGAVWERQQVRGLEGHNSGLFLEAWPVLESFTRREAAVDVDGYRVVLTGWFSTGDSALVGARVEDPTTGNVLAERTFADGYVGARGFELVDGSGLLLVAVDAATIRQADFGHVGQTEAIAHDGPSWRVDTNVEPWIAVPIG